MAKKCSAKSRSRKQASDKSVSTSKSNPSSSRDRGKKAPSSRNSVKSDPTKKKELSKSTSGEKTKSICRKSSQLSAVSQSPNINVDKFGLADKLKEVQPEENNNSNSGRPEFDETQWENTRFADLAKMGSKELDKESIKVVNEGKGLLGEDKQKHVVRGEHLLKRSYLLLALLGVETVLCAISIGVWGGKAENPVAPMVIALVNLAICFIMLIALVLTEIFRFHVTKLDRFGGDNWKYTISARCRFVLFVAHLLRLIFVCSNITIMALDNDLDIDVGSVIVLALQPVMLLFSILQMWLSLRARPTKGI